MNTPIRPMTLIASTYLFTGASAFWSTAAIATLFAIPQYSRYYGDLRQDADAGSVAALLLVLAAGVCVAGACVAVLLAALDAYGHTSARWLSWVYSGLTALGRVSKVS